jgi:hypothetical protein
MIYHISYSLVSIGNFGHSKSRYIILTRGPVIWTINLCLWLCMNNLAIVLNQFSVAKIGPHIFQTGIIDQIVNGGRTDNHSNK